MKYELTIKLGDYEIVAEVATNEEGIPPELWVYLRDSDGIISQDICLVRPHYEWQQSGESTISNDYMDCLVWADHENEDYTHKHIIEVHKWEEE